MVKGFSKETANSLLHPAMTSALPKGRQLAQEPQLNINAGYAKACNEMTSRFDVNNKELNKRRFAE